ncbi:unnamed protein product [Tilletia laevis]|uniref:Uncharacterized protein n=3 Tax=Tilletia TaxID=13289 RepID=A0A8X7MY30_9BASI|nr:hypothetical protein CF336_g1794 [Tilletia laevis]KAE8207408.1 hypothetical protein CF335_g1158 [Tilletia laevis]KAE8252410.1 hypothetical protein A4X06_0g2207 [Tilletia controversa]KAE8260614.1 hypothetical protein A4X03_0g3749 [Tilletia caries]CAD6928655.1 unnamed protein product [Tilletia laevis]
MKFSIFTSVMVAVVVLAIGVMPTSAQRESYDDPAPTDGNPAACEAWCARNSKAPNCAGECERSGNPPSYND